MAARDIMPWNSPSGGHEPPKAFPIAASQSFLIGEPVALSSGQAAEPSSDPATLLGIAAEPGVDADGAALATNLPVTVYPVTDASYFITRNYAEDGAGTAATPAASDVGNAVGLTLASGSWFADAGAANPHFRVVAVLDQKNFDVTDPRLLPGTGVKVVLGPL